MTSSLNTLNSIKKIIKISGDKNKTTNEKLDEIIRFLTKITKTSKGSIMIKKDRLTMEVVASTEPSLIGIRQSLNGESPACWVFKNKKTLYINTDQDFKSQSHGNENGRYNKNSFVVIPIILQDEDVIGVISLTDKQTEDAFSDDERKILIDLTGIIISQIETFRLTNLLKEQHEMLDKKNIELKKLEKMRSEFFQMMVHDLKGPVSEVISNLDILSYTINDDNKEYVELAQSGCSTMYRMISNLLDITRLEEGSLTLIREQIPATDLISEAISRQHSSAKIKNIQILSEFNHEHESYIWADRGILLRVFQNLITNALLHSNTKKHIYIDFHKSDNNIIFSIRDEGEGIPVDIQKNIFNKYFHSGKNSSSTGLGLAFCKMAVEAHKGVIWVESDGHSGSCFKFSIPELPDNSKEDIDIYDRN